MEGDRATTAIWEREIFLRAGPVGRRQGYDCNLGTRDFLVAGPVEGDRATTAIWELEIFWWQVQVTRDFLVAGPVATRQGYYCNLGTRDFLGGRPSWEMTGLQL